MAAKPAVLQITLDSETYTIAMDELTARDAREFRSAVGMPLAAAMFGAAADLDVVAGLVWLVKRRDNPSLKYAEVENSLTYGSDFTVNNSGVTEEPEPGEA